MQKQLTQVPHCHVFHTPNDVLYLAFATMFHSQNISVALFVQFLISDAHVIHPTILQVF